METTATMRFRRFKLAANATSSSSSKMSLSCCSFKEASRYLGRTTSPNCTVSVVDFVVVLAIRMGASLSLDESLFDPSTNEVCRIVLVDVVEGLGKATTDTAQEMNKIDNIHRARPMLVTFFVCLAG